MVSEDEADETASLSLILYTLVIHIASMSHVNIY